MNNKIISITVAACTLMVTNAMSSVLPKAITNTDWYKKGEYKTTASRKQIKEKLPKAKIKLTQAEKERIQSQHNAWNANINDAWNHRAKVTIPSLGLKEVSVNEASTLMYYVEEQIQPDFCEIVEEVKTDSGRKSDPSQPNTSTQQKLDERYIPYQTIKTYAQTDQPTYQIDGTEYDTTKYIVLNSQLKSNQIKAIKQLVDDGVFEMIRTNSKILYIEK